MPPESNESSLSTGEMFADAILSNSSMRDGLQDDVAKPYLEWATQLAVYVGDNMDEDSDQEKIQANLNRLIMFITRFTVRRQDKDKEWAADYLDKMDQFSTNINGKTLTDAQREIILSNFKSWTDKETIDKLTQIYDMTQPNRAINEMETRPMPIAKATPETSTDLNIGNLMKALKDKVDDTSDEAPKDGFDEEMQDEDGI